MFIVIVSIILFIFAFIALGYDQRERRFQLNRRQFLAPLALLVMLLGMVAKVDANEVGIVYDPFRGGIQEASLPEGLHFKSPFQQVIHIRTTNRTAYLEVAGQTEDSIYAVFQITLVYRVESLNAGKFFKVTGNNDIAPDQLTSMAKEALQSATTQYDIYNILGSELETVRQDFVTRLGTLLSTRYNISVVSASFDDIDAGSRIEEIIQNKAEAIQLIEIAQQEKQRASVEAETAIIRAENAAQVDIIAAEGAAEAQIILNSVSVNAIVDMFLGQFEEGEDTSTPEAFGYLSIQEITDVVLAQLYYDAWDGVLPEVITDGAGLIIQP
jgi:regulator of protease activity HflC (stomatin/prohibitin superfamily)